MSSRQEGSRSEAEVMEILGQITPPEFEADLVTLGMVSRVSLTPERIGVTLFSPTPNYPFRPQVTEAIQAALAGEQAVEVSYESEITADPQVRGKLGLAVKRIVAVASGKGGVGKSTVSVNLAATLASEGAKVGLMDADIYGPNIPMMMGVTEMPPVQQGKLTPAVAHGVRFISMGFLMPEGKPLIWRGPMLHKALQQLFTDVRWGELDYLIIDLPPGTGDVQLSLAQIAPLSGGVIVTMPQMVSVADARRGAAAFEQLEVPILGVIENMSGEVFGSGGGPRAAQDMGVPYLGSVTLDSSVREGGDNGRPIVISAPGSDAARSLRQLARLVALRLHRLDPEPDLELNII